MTRLEEEKFDYTPQVSIWIPHGYMRDLMDYSKEVFVSDTNIDYRFIFLEPPTQELRTWVRENYVRPGSKSKDMIRLHVSALIEVRLPWIHYEQLRDNMYSAVLTNEYPDKD
tara:strand:- start:1300 stop:1635 length:336 start_codon:yes stop_codon:yes gene_type:complete